MKFKEFFLGTAEEQEAAQTKNALSDLGNLNARKKAKLERATRISRRRFLRLGATGAATAAMATFGGKALLGQSVTKELAPSAKNSENLEPDREKLVQGWMEPFAQMVRASSDPLAKKVLEFVEENGTLAKPMERGIKFIKGGNGPLWFALVVLTKGDADSSKILADLYNIQGVAGQFMPDQKILLLKEKEYGNISQLWKGILFGHEAFHAYDFINHPYDWKDHSKFLSHEILAHEFENKLIRREGKEAYGEFLERQIGKLVKVNNEAGAVGNGVSVLTSAYEPVLDKIFGPSQSQLENNLRGTHTAIDSVFEFIERTFPKEQHVARKMDCLKNLYQEANLMPK